MERERREEKKRGGKREVDGLFLYREPPHKSDIP